MVIYLYGKDSYRRNQKLKELIFAYREKHPAMDFLSVDFEEDEEGFARARDFLKQPSMFVDSKLLVMKEIAALPEKERKALTKILKPEAETSKTFIIISDSEESLSDFKFLLEEPVKHQSFAVLRDKALDQFLATEAVQRRLKFERSAWNFLISYLSAGEETTWRGINELEKFALAGFKSPVALQDVQSLIHSAELGPVFKVAREFLRITDHKKKLALLERVLLHGEEAAYFFNSLGFQARGKDLFCLADYDIKIKSGKADYEEALTEFALS
jgi:DNA polymerase III delta subunit